MLSRQILYAQELVEALTGTSPFVSAEYEVQRYLKQYKISLKCKNVTIPDPSDPRYFVLVVFNKPGEFDQEVKLVEIPKKYKSHIECWLEKKGL